LVLHRKRYWGDETRRVRCARNWHVCGRTAYRALMEKPGETRSLVRTRKRWKHNIKIDFQEIRFEGVEFIGVA
jgi:hypothetical protein